MNEEFWRDKSVLVTGASGFVGSHLLRALTGRTHILLPSIGSRRFDLRSEDEVKRMFDSALLHGRGIDMLFHLAATVGGIGANRDRPADFYYDNAMMNALIVKYSTLANVGKLVCLGSVCA